MVAKNHRLAATARFWPRGLAIGLLAALSIGMLVSTSSAEMDEKVAEAAGAYLGSIAYLERFGRSECGYIMKRSHRIEDAIVDINRYLTREESAELTLWLKRGKAKMRHEATELIDRFLHAASQDGTDIKTACGILVAIIAQMSRDAEMQWQTAVHFRRPK